jgi:hypothetical protein
MSTFTMLSADIQDLKNRLLYSDRMIELLNSIKTHVASLKFMILGVLEKNKQFLTSDSAKLATETVRLCLDKKDVNLTQLASAMRIVFDSVMHCRVLQQQQNQPLALEFRQVVLRPSRETQCGTFQALSGTLEEKFKAELALMREKERLMAEMGTKMRQMKELVRTNSDMSIPVQVQVNENVQSANTFELVSVFFGDFVFEKTEHLNACYSVCFQIC